MSKKTLPDIPFIDIHTHRFVSAADIIAVENIFAADMPRYTAFHNRTFSVGLHPWHINELTCERDILNIEETSKSPDILAIGEAGLDKVCKIDFKLQEAVFTKQLEIAGNCGKPMIIHCVKAFQEIFSIYKKTMCDATLIFHGFNNNFLVAENLLKHDFYISFGQALLNRKSNVYTIFNQIPADHFFLETDDSGCSIEEIYAEASRIRGISVLEMKNGVFNVFKNCFKAKE